MAVLGPGSKNPKDWDVLDVQDWLRRSGYGKYCAQFLLEDTTGPELLNMTKTSLVLLGVSDPGLLRAIQLLKDESKFQMPVSDATINGLIRDLERTSTWLLRRVGELYEMPPLEVYDLTKEILQFRPSVLPKSKAYGSGSNMFKERFSKGDSVEALRESMHPPKTTEQEKPDITTLAQLTKAAAAAARSGQSGSNKNSDIHRFADQSRFDLKLKGIRRNNRIILPAELQNDHHEDDADNNEARFEQIQKQLIDEKQIPPKYMLFPTDTLRTRFDFLMILLVAYFSITTPLNLGFDLGLDSNVYVEMFLNFLFLIDIVSNFFTAFVITEGSNAGKVEIRYWVIAKKYLQLWFWIDMVATVPIDLIITLSGGHSSGGSLNKLIRLVRGFKLMRVMKMSRITQRLVKRVRINPALFRIIKIVCALCFMWHCLGSFYWMIATSETESSGWRPPDRYNDAAISDQYLRAFFWAVNCTMTIGTDIFPENNLEVCFTIFSICCGLISNALVIGSIKSAIEELDMASKVHRQDLEDLQSKLSLYQISTGLKRQIIGYFRFLQSRYLDYTAREMFKGLHPALREDLLLNLNQQLISQVPMFRDVPRGCMLSIISKLQSRVYLPREYIVMCGEKGLEMFFIVNGAVEARKDETTPAVTLRDGDYFCENNLMTTKRVDVNYRALTYTEVSVLDRNSLKRLLQQFPAFALTMQRHMKQNMAKKKWAKVEHVFRLTHLIHKMGGDSNFSEAFTSYNQGTLPGIDDIALAKELVGDDLEPLRKDERTLFSFGGGQKTKDTSKSDVIE